ncbi:MAG TPA: helicase-related protein [Ktedonobacterales bacterium]|nr:helicase-related protein [Ktedonobacterales bacterium]
MLDDHDGGMGSGDRMLRVRGVDTQPGGIERIFIYRPSGAADSAAAGARLERVTALAAPELHWNPGTPPSQWERLLTAYRLSIAHSAGHLLGLSRTRLVIEPYQLAPVLRVMSAPRQRFLLAEDVGMGKTIEAGLVAMELIARGRGDRILIVVPAALQDQWADEMRDKFGLDFAIFDSDSLSKDLIPRLPSGANPWEYVSRVITSVDFAKQERILRALKKTRWDLMIVDEAHYLAESGTDATPTRTDRSRLGEALAPLCESLLLLTATPHNGYSQGFYSLLRLLDDARFASASDLRREAVEQVVIRRTKKQIYNPDKTQKFHGRTVYHLELALGEPAMAAERRLYEAVTRYVARHWRAARRSESERVTVGFAMTVLKKRLISSLGAIRASLRTRLEGLSDEPVAPDARRGLLASYRAGVPLTETQREHVERQLVTLTPERGAEALERERREVERLLRLAETIAPEQDSKAAYLKRTLDHFCLTQERKVIVFTEYKDTLDYLLAYLEARGYAGRIATLHGHLNRAQRQAAERQFHQPETLILLATDAASEGLNLQHGCWTVIHNELPWNPNRLEQRNGRVDRWGQTHDVEIYNLVLTDTLEGQILKRLDEKLARIREELGDGSDVLSVTGPLDLDSLLMDASAAEEPFDTAVAGADARVEQALREGREALEACRAEFLIAPGAFGPKEYAEVRAAEAVTARALPHPEELEAFATGALRALGGVATPVDGQSHVWALETPQRLRRAGVEARYDRATFIRETALAESERPPALAYLALGHPLLDALIAAVKTDARDGGALAGRMSLRVLRGAPAGFLFAWLGRWQDARGALAAEEIVPVFVGLDDATIPASQAANLLAAVGLPRNAPPDLLASRYEPRWAAARERARALAAERVAERADRVRERQAPQLEILRRDIEVWAEARLAWVERRLARRAEQEIIQGRLLLEEGERASERALAAAETRRQNELRREREVIASRRREREAEIERMERIAPVAPELIGALVIAPEEEL